MKNFEYLMRALSEPAYITMDSHRNLDNLLDAWMQGKIQAVAKGPDEKETVEQEEVELAINPIQTIKVRGVLMRRADAFSEACFGACSAARIQKQAEFCRTNDAVRAVVLDINSPGGQVAGTLEAANAIYRLAQEKPVIAAVESLAASGGYFLASQANRIIAEPTALLANIGVYMAYYDDSEWMKKHGYRLEVFRAGKFKAAGMGRPLQKEEEDQYQTIVDQAYVQFKEAVLRCRPEVADGSMQGLIYSASDAMDLKLCDEVSDDLDAAVATAIAEVLSTLSDSNIE